VPISSKEKAIQAGRKALEEARKAVGNINTHEADILARRKSEEIKWKIHMNEKKQLTF
jgi:hypothetical protein